MTRISEFKKALRSKGIVVVFAIAVGVAVACFVVCRLAVVFWFDDCSSTYIIRDGQKESTASSIKIVKAKPVEDPPHESKSRPSVPYLPDAVRITMWADKEILPEPGKHIEVSVNIDHVKNLGGFQLDIDYNPEVFSISEGDIALGSALKSSGRRASLLAPQIESGKVTVGGFSYGNQAGFSGGADMMKFRFTVKNKGDGLLSLKNVILADAAAKPIAVGGIENGDILLR